MPPPLPIYRLQLDSLRPIFNAVEGVDFGPGTARPIRYALRSQFGRMLSKYFKPVGGSFANFSPVGQTFTIGLRFPDGSTTTISQSGLIAQGDPMKYSGSYSTADEGGIATHTDFSLCPLLPDEPEDGIHEDAQISYQVSTMTLSGTFSMRTPAMTQESWEAALTDGITANRVVWLPFSLTMPDTTWQQVYECAGETHQTGELDEGTVTSGFAGIDYGDGSPLALAGYDSRIALGDGTTFLYFTDPGGARWYLTAFGSTEGL